MQPKVSPLKQLQIIFYCGWTLLALLQAYFTELQPDEAYYWMYSQELSWGYFDHPPMIALLIKLGYGIFANELGARLLSSLLFVVGIFLLEKLVKPMQLGVFYAIVAAVGLLHMFGFLAVPDAPLFFFCVLYLHAFRAFLERENLRNALWLGLGLAGMIYSKYHGLLIAGLTVLPFLKRFVSSGWAWLSLAFAAVLLSPHIYWLYANDFPSFSYHLVERSTEPFDYRNTLNYVSAQPFIIGPLISLLFFIALFKERVKSEFEKALKWLFWGAYIFFLLMTIKDRVEDHWTFFCVVPGIYFTYRWALNGKKQRKWVMSFAGISIVLLLIGRIFMAVDLLPNKGPTEVVHQNFHHRKTRALGMQQLSEGKPVVFMNSYQEASLYQFYTGQPAMSLSNIWSRKSQFDLWNYEQRFRGKDVMVWPNYLKGDAKTTEIDGEKRTYLPVVNFQSYSKIKIEAKQVPASIRSCSVFPLEILISNPDELDVLANPNFPSELMAVWYKGGEHVGEFSCALPITPAMFDKALEIDVQVPEESGEIGLYLCMKTGFFPTTYNSRRYLIDVE